MSDARYFVVKSCRECPWIEPTTMAGIIDDETGNPKDLIWCLGADDIVIDLDKDKLDEIHKDCPLSKVKLEVVKGRIKNICREMVIDDNIDDELKIHYDIPGDNQENVEYE